MGLSQDELKFRHGEILKKIRKGWSRKKMCDWAVQQWGITIDTAYKYIHDVYAELATKIDDEIEITRKISLERIEEILRAAMERTDDKGRECPDSQTALKAIDMINRLYSLYVDKQEVKVDGQVKFTFGSE